MFECKRYRLHAMYLRGQKATTSKKNVKYHTGENDDEDEKSTVGREMINLIMIIKYIYI